DEFDAGAYATEGSDVNAAERLVALQWARIGWAKFLKGGSLGEPLRYLNAAWGLGQAGAVADRLARVYEKGYQPAEAKQWEAMAIAAGGADAEQWKAKLAKLDPTGAEHDIALARTEMVRT